MIEFTPLLPHHIGQLDLPDTGDYARPVHPQFLCLPGLAFAGLVDGLVVGAAGILPQWPGRAIAWTLFTPIKRREWPKITAKVAEVLQRAGEQGYCRIEAYVDASSPAAARWVRRLGFALETPAPMQSWASDGRAFLLFARISRQQERVADATAVAA